MHLISLHPLLFLHRHTVLTVQPVPPSVWKPTQICHRVSFSICWHPSISDLSQYSLTTLILLRQWPTWCKLALVFNTFIIFLYMFQALHGHHQEGKLYWCSICYRPLSQWPSGAQVERELTGWPLTERTILDAASIQFSILMMTM